MASIEPKKNYNFRKNQKKKIRKKNNKILTNVNVNSENSTILPEYPSKIENLEEFKLTDGFERFSMEFKHENLENNESQKPKFHEDLPRKAIVAAILESNENKDDDEGEKMSKKRWKKLNRISIGDLKIKAKKPDLVEPYDNCSPDPLFLLELKSKRNTVPVPRHWCAAGKYLQSKRGFVKPPFKLPDFIAKTGIMEMRQTADDKEMNKSLKNKMKDKIRPKVGMVDISYQKLHNAFFVEQTKPDLTKFGDIYYQGKELEAKRKQNRPGKLSDELRSALGMTVGPNCEKVPPPWLISQQRYGPPPSYPNLKIPGLNAGIPQGCSFGFHIGGWGKPPIDDDGKPLYGDVFANAFNTVPVLFDFDAEEEEDKYWGEVESNGDDSEVEDEDDDDDKSLDEEEEIEKENTSLNIASSQTPPKISTSNIELRPKIKVEKKSDSGENKTLFKIVPEVKTNIASSSIMGSEKLYEVSHSESNIQLQKRKNEQKDKDERKAKKHKEFKF